MATRFPACCLVLLLALVGCSIEFRIGGGRTGSSFTAPVPEPTIELTHPSRHVSCGLQISPVSGYPTLIVQAQGTAGRFILDTGGAGALIVTEAFLERAGGRYVRSASATINGSRYAVAVIPELHIGDGLILHNATCLISDLDQMQQVCGGVTIDGVLTVGLLQGLEIDIDLPRHVVHFRPAHLATQPAHAIELSRPASHAGDTRPYAVVSIGDAEVPALLDTGNYAAIDIPEHLFRQAHVELLQERASFGAAGFNSRAAVTRRGRLAQMRLGAIALNSTEAHIIPHQDVSEAVIGIAVLRHYRLIYNTHTRATFLIGPTALADAQPGEEVVQLVEQICRTRTR